MALHQETDRAYFEQVVEEDIIVTHKLLVDRYLVPITEGVSQYQLPDWVTSIRRITYRGRQLDPFSGQELINSGSTPERSIQGEPKEYVYNYLGERIIKLYPAPSETLSTIGDRWSGSIIRETCIVECFRAPDFAFESQRLPSWLRRALIRDKVNEMLAEIDDQGYGSKVQAQFKKKSQLSTSNVLRIKKKLFSCMDKELQPTIHSGPHSPSRPHLPWQFGVRVD